VTDVNILLDSHALLWALHDPGRLTARASSTIRDVRNAVYFSAASAWELEIKAAKGKLTLPDNWLAVAEDTGFLQIPVTAVVARAGARLPWHHSDPFDRVLIAQAVEHELHIVTRDPWVAAYGVPVLPC
jgi:PIN domain nuclease of toxin-antitoxin system